MHEDLIERLESGADVTPRDALGRCTRLECVNAHEACGYVSLPCPYCEPPLVQSAAILHANGDGE